MTRRVELHTTHVRIAKALTTEFTEKGTTLVIVEDVAKMPKSADMVVSTAATNSKDEWTAARLGCVVAIIPEAMAWIRQQLEMKGSLVIVGADRGKA